MVKTIILASWKVAENYLKQIKITNTNSQDYQEYKTAYNK